ncbi:MAG TPA: S41 family peptidase [Clostridia bacterium]|nr:S41 family peptidase [Clostridia bacterium]
MKKLVCGILIVLLLLCSACAQEQTFESVLAEANALHKAQAEMVPEESIRDYVPKLPETELGFTEEELVSLTEGINQRFNGQKRISLAQAKQDVDLLFRVFRYCYGVYEYFGGDEVFTQAKASVLNDLEALGTGFNASDMTAVLRKHLAYIKDGHFAINYTTIHEMQSYFSAEELTFNRDNHGFYASVEGEKQYLLSVDGNTNLEDHMKLSIGPDGGLTYRLGMLYDKAIRNKAVSTEFEKTTILLKLENSASTQTYDAALTYSEDWESKVPVVACRDLTTPETCNRFINSASRLSSSKVAILDLRGNRGGSPYVVNWWLKAYGPGGLDEYWFGTSSMYRSGKALSYILARSMDAGANYFSLWDENNSLRNNYMKLYQTGENSYDISRENIPLKQLEAEGILFVLMDDGNCSAGEVLLFALRNRKNTILVGTNSNGCLLGGTGQQVVLPNSKIIISYGNGLMFWYDERVFQEGRGFLPDIWVNGDALERVQKLIEYYGVE